MFLLQATANLENSELITRISFLVLMPVLVAFSFIVFVFFRRNRENALRRQALELELTAIRAQMNPHFIFNCLNSIHYCIQKNQSERAGHYLLQFSFLTRRILENSSKRFIPLSEEVDILNSYLNLEQLRSNDRFTFEVKVNESIEADAVAVPMLLVQPLVENAVWHGFESRTSSGFISIEIDQVGDEIVFRVADNGVVQERFEKMKMPGKEKSMGKNLVASQLNAIAELEGRECKFESEIRRNHNSEYLGMTSHIAIPLISVY